MFGRHPGSPAHPLPIAPGERPHGVPTQDSFSEMISLYPTGDSRRGLTLIGGADDLDSDWTAYVVRDQEPQQNGIITMTPPKITLTVQTGRGRAGIVSNEGIGEGDITIWARGRVFHFVGTELKIDVATQTLQPALPCRLSAWVGKGRPSKRTVMRQCAIAPSVASVEGASLDLGSPALLRIPTFATHFRCVSLAGGVVNQWTTYNINGFNTVGPVGSIATASGASANPNSGFWIPLPVDSTLLLLVSTTLVDLGVGYVEWLIES